MGFVLRARLILLAVLGLLVLLLSGSVRAQVPVCTFECPPQDLATRPLLAESTSASELFCRYQSVPSDFFCKYFLDTGLLKQDHDNGFCQLSVADRWLLINAVDPADIDVSAGLQTALSCL